MKRISVTPLKEIEGVPFGETRTSVRRAFGKFTESKRYDDFKWCKAIYDRNNKLEAIDIMTEQCTVVVGSSQVFCESANKVQRTFGILSNSDKNRGIRIQTNPDGRVTSILFGKKGFLESTNDQEYQKTLTDLAGKDVAKKETESEENKRQENIDNLRAANNTGKQQVKDAVDKVVDQDKKPLKMEDGDTLLQFYDDLKNRLNSDASDTGGPAPMRVSGGVMSPMSHPGTIAYKQQASIECDKLKNNCAKHILLDIYCNVLPLDGSFIAGNMGTMRSDVDAMLASKGMTPSQYLTSCSESTSAPLLQFINQCINDIGIQFMEDANEKLKDAQEQDIKVDPPEAPDPDAEPQQDNDVSSQLIDVKKDTEYENFVETLKEKTVKKIVADVSKIINDKKEDKEMEFDPKPMNQEETQTESAISIGLQYLQKKAYMERVMLDPELMDDMMGLAIREATLLEIDRCFNQPGSQLNEFANRIRMGRGALINESSAQYFIESSR